MKSSMNLIVTFVFLSIINIGILYQKTGKTTTPESPVVQTLPPVVLPAPVLPPATPKITTQIPPYMPYSKIPGQLQEWHKEAPALTSVGTYGQSTRGQDLCYLLLTNKSNVIEKKKVLITACIHGNEPLSTTTIMAFLGTMLGTYGADAEVTGLIDSREIYFVPVVSPDSYPNSRHVDGVDPNRNFPTAKNPSFRSVKPVQAIGDFFLKHKFNAAISGHTFGRIYLTPYGEKNDLCPNNDDYNRIIGEMCRLSKYKKSRACEMYGRPIYGSDVDFYFRNGGFSIVLEFGTHQNIPSLNDTKAEFNLTYKAFLHFLKEAPLINVKPVKKSDSLSLNFIRQYNQFCE